MTKVTEIDLAAAQETTPVVYRDGDEDDTALTLEEEQGIASLMAAAPGLWLVHSNDPNGTIRWSSYLLGNGEVDRSLSDDVKAMLESAAFLQRYATMVDADGEAYGGAEGIDKPALVDADMVNVVIATPGSRIAYEYNYRLLEGILPSKADVTSAALALTLATAMGQVERAVVVGTPDWGKVVAKMGFTLSAKLADTFDRSKVMKSLKPRNYGVATRVLSRVGTVRFIRYHTLGGYSTTKATDQVYSQSLDTVAAVDKPKERKDAIVVRSMALLGLNPKVQSDLDSYYLFAKSLDPLATVYSQIAQEAKSGQQLTLSEFSAGGAAMQGILNAHTGGNMQQIKVVRIMPFAGDGDRDGHVCTAWVASRVDRSCLPGFKEYRVSLPDRRDPQSFDLVVLEPLRGLDRQRGTGG